MKKVFFVGMLCALMLPFSYAQSFKPSPADVPVPAGPLLITEDQSVDHPVRSVPTPIATTYPAAGQVNNAVNNTINVYPPTTTVTTGKSRKGYNKPYRGNSCCKRDHQVGIQQNEYWRGKYDGFCEGLKFNPELKQTLPPVATKWYDDLAALLLLLGVIALIVLLVYFATRQQQPSSVTVQNIPPTPPVSPAPSAIVPPSKEELEMAMDKAKVSGSIFSRKADGAYEIVFMEPKAKETKPSVPGQEIEKK